MNPLSFKLYAGDGTQSLFSVTFPYISRSHVKVTVSGVDIPVPVWQDASTIRIEPPPAVGAVVEIKRETSPEVLLVDFEDGSKINESILNLSANQLFYLAQEGLDRVIFDYQLASLETLKEAAELAAAAAQQSAASIALPLPVTSGGTGVTSLAALKALLSLGTAASKNFGTADGNLVEVQAGGKLPALSGESLTAIPGTIVQDVSFIVSDAVAGTTLIPADDTIPQITEGFQVISGSFTPKAPGNRIVIELLVQAAASVATNMSACVFRDAIPDAIFMGVSTVAANSPAAIVARYSQIVGSVTPRTYSVRVGAASAGTVTVNGATGTRRWGGVYYSTLRIYEVQV